MPQIKLYIAATLDGFIAREDGSLDWLDALPNSNQVDHGYTAFYDTIGTVVMGRSTYEAILSFDVDYPYAECATFVVTTNESYPPQTANTAIINELNPANFERIKATSQKDVWVVGGGQLITAFLNHRQIDELILCLVPIVLGKGIPLFPNQPLETNFELIETVAFETGIVNLRYKARPH